MKKIPIYQVDAFTSTLFEGNPAAVCVLDEWPDDTLMQSISAENNLSETAFVVKSGADFGIRWFTPQVEVDLCGHATLASAYVVFNELDYPENEIRFHSKYKGILGVYRQGDQIILDFPAEQVTPADPVEAIEKGIGIKPLGIYEGDTKVIAEVEKEEDVVNLRLDFSEIAKLDKGLIVTAPGNQVDFVSRFFVPQYGINEDPVTGSAHTLLTPFWSQKLNKKELTARQLSTRGGELHCSDEGSRVRIGGTARMYLKGDIFVDL
jgi:PhzF family phenazine biosynthesis protein